MASRRMGTECHKREVHIERGRVLDYRRGLAARVRTHSTDCATLGSACTALID